MKALLFGYPLAALVLAACASTPPNLNDDLVVRGKRIGEIEIGMPLATLLAVKGAPVRTAPIPGTDATTYSFPNGLTVGRKTTIPDAQDRCDSCRRHLLVGD